MAEAFVDVNLELDPAVLMRAPEPGRVVVEIAREAAERQCFDTGAHLRTDREPEFLVQRAITLAGKDVVLVASRWAVRGSALLFP